MIKTLTLCPVATFGERHVTTQAVITDFPHSSSHSNSTSHSGGLKEASGVDRLWDPATNMASWTLGRDVTYMLQVWKTAIPIFLSDMVAVGLSVALSAAVFAIFGDLPSVLNWTHIVAWCLFLSGACLLSGLYPAVGMVTATEIRLLARVIGAGVALCMAYDLAHGGDNKYLLLWPLYGVFMLALVPLSRAFFRRAVCRFEWWGLPTIVVGAGDLGMDIWRRMKQKPTLGYKPVAIVDRYRPNWIIDKETQPKSGISPLEDTPRLSARYQAYCGIFVGSEFPAAERMTMIDTLTSVFPQLYITPDSADAGRHWSGALELGNLRLLKFTERLLMPGARWLKRAVDVLAVLIVSPFVLTVVGCLALLVKLTSAGPAFYCHPRIGRNGRTIRVWKMRSMVPNADRLLKEYLAENPHLRSEWERIHKLPNDPRVTFIGRFLRKTSLDEIPQLWNVFCGEMSLVGPRPIVQAEIDKYQSVYPLYLRVTPGITGLWQVNGRNSTTYEARISYDAEYVRNWSVCLDLYILARTVLTVITCDGAC